jgi:hypothetical protein
MVNEDRAIWTVRFFSCCERKTVRFFRAIMNTKPCDLNRAIMNTKPCDLNRAIVSAKLCDFSPCNCELAKPCDLCPCCFERKNRAICFVRLWTQNRAICFPYCCERKTVRFFSCCCLFAVLVLNYSALQGCFWPDVSDGSGFQIKMFARAEPTNVGEWKLNRSTRNASQRFDKIQNIYQYLYILFCYISEPTSAN